MLSSMSFDDHETLSLDVAVTASLEDPRESPRPESHAAGMSFPETPGTMLQNE